MRSCSPTVLLDLEVRDLLALAERLQAEAS